MKRRDMSKELITVAFMYDFDETLSPNYMQEYSLLPMLDISNNEFWSMCNRLSVKNNMDGILSYMHSILECAKKSNIQIKREDMVKQGHVIEFFEGVEEYFDKINEFGRSIGLNVEHYIISSGLKELIEGSKIAHNFKRVYASSFAYDENDVAFWPAQAVNYTTKTQYIFRIKKNKLDNLYDNREVNEYVYQKEALLPYSRMVYVGDGLTDIPCMKVIKDKGGTSICVYDPAKPKSKLEAERVYADKRVNYMAAADYRENSMLFSILKDVLNKIALDSKLDTYK